MKGESQTHELLQKLYFVSFFCPDKSSIMAEMDQEVAQRLFSEGGMMLILDVPQGTEFGFDCNSWKIGSKFKGVKMIPPGVHFVFYSSVSKEGQTAPRTGFFCFLKKKEIVVKKWDKDVEDVVGGDGSSENIERIRAAMKELDKFLGAYPYESYKKWVSLTDKITQPLLDRLQPTSGKISSVTQVPSTEEFRPETSKMEVDGENLNISFETSPEHRIRFTEIPRKRYPDGSSPAEITRHSIDSTYVLESMMQHMKDKIEVLGELQFAFVCFLLGQVYDAFEHWKGLLQVLCTSDDALSKYPDLFNAFIGVLHFQLLEAPKDFFVDIVTKNNFLTVTLQVFFSNLETSSNVDENLVKKAQRFRKHLTKRFQWDFESEPDEYEPVIVEM